MDEHSYLGRLERVAAPPGFERRVLAELVARREGRRRSARIHRFAYAGGAAVFLAGALIVGALVLDRNGGDRRVASGGPARTSSEVIPVLETLDYSSEFRNASSDPRTIYILEQVSEVSPREITY